MRKREEREKGRRKKEIRPPNSVITIAWRGPAPQKGRRGEKEKRMQEKGKRFGERNRKKKKKRTTFDLLDPSSFLSR